MEDASMVIKVKYEDVLRRFNARIVDKQFELTVDELREKIISLFNFAPCTKLILTYTDEHGDGVNLVDDDDLIDVVKQGLNPLRITVKLIRNSDLRMFGSSCEKFVKKFVKFSHDLISVFVNPKPSDCERSIQEENSIVDGSFMTKLDSLFVSEVSMMNGAILSPSTAFTKIWRMKNNGRVEWPKKTLIVWIGGDKLSKQSHVELEISEGGLPVDHELDIVVEMISPAVQGDYVSYWRLVSPSGEKFGQPILAIVQVEEPSIKEVPCSLINIQAQPENSIEQKLIVNTRFEHFWRVVEEEEVKLKIENCLRHLIIGKKEKEELILKNDSNVEILTKRESVLEQDVRKRESDKEELIILKHDFTKDEILSKKEHDLEQRSSNEEKDEEESLSEVNNVPEESLSNEEKEKEEENNVSEDEDDFWGFEDSFMNKMEKRKNISKNILLKKKNNRWKL